MAIIDVSDATYRRLLALAQALGKTPHELLDGLLDELPEEPVGVDSAERERRIAAFQASAGSLHTAQPVDPRDIDEALADELLDTHDDEP